MKTNEAGIALIKQSEGLRLEAYLCAGGKPTIGYGSTSGVKLGDRITEKQADERLRKDLETAEKAVTRLVKVPLTSNQFSALVSFVFNLGAGNLATSTLLSRLNAGDYKAAQGQFKRWNLANGKIEKGLIARRKAEADLFGRV